MIGLFMQSIKEAFLLSDTQLGFLTGIAFALFYSILGIPIARWADRGNRVTIISIAIALWGVMAIACGLVTNFFQLLLVRVLAAVGEAGVMPPAYSLISDYFNVQERARAVSIYLLAIPISILLSFCLAGWLGELYGWRMAFLVVGLPGLLVAALVKLTLKEPRQCNVTKVSAHPDQTLPLGQVIKLLWQQRSFRYLLIGATLSNFVGIGVGQWYATFFIRSHGLSIGELGLWLGLITGIGGAAGVFGGGFLAGRYLNNNPQLQVRLTAALPLVTFPLTLIILLVPSSEMALWLLIPSNILGFIAMGPITAIILQLVEQRIRATAMALFSLVINLVGMGLGPQLVGILSDLLVPSLGEDSLRYAMIIASLAIFVMSYCYWSAAKSVKRDTELISRREVSTPFLGSEVAVCVVDPVP